MKSYYEILELVKNGKEPKMLVLKLNCGSRLYKANYDQDEFSYYGLVDSELENNNFKYYLADTLLESEMFDEIIEIKEVCHNCGRHPAEYNQTYCEFCLGISQLIEPLNIKQEKNCKGNWKWQCNGYNISTPQKIIANKLNEIIKIINDKEDIK